MRIGCLGFVGEDALADELVEIIGADCGSEAEEYTVEAHAISIHSKYQGMERVKTYNTTAPIPTVALLTLHLLSLPYKNVVQFLSLSAIFFCFAPSTMPWVFQTETAMKAANQSIVYSASTVRKAYAFAKRSARDHIGTMTKYIIAGIDRKHCGDC